MGMPRKQPQKDEAEAPITRILADILVQTSLELLMLKHIKRPVETSEKHRMGPTVSIGPRGPGSQVEARQENQPYGHKHKILLLKKGLYFHCFLHS